MAALHMVITLVLCRLCESRKQKIITFETQFQNVLIQIGLDSETPKRFVQDIEIISLAHLKSFTNPLKYLQIPIGKDPDVPNFDTLKVAESSHGEIAKYLQSQTQSHICPHCTVVYCTVIVFPPNTMWKIVRP